MQSFEDDDEEGVFGRGSHRSQEILYSGEGEEEEEQALSSLELPTLSSHSSMH